MSRELLAALAVLLLSGSAAYILEVRRLQHERQLVESRRAKLAETARPQGNAAPQSAPTERGAVVASEREAVAEGKPVLEPVLQGADVESVEQARPAPLTVRQSVLLTFLEGGGLTLRELSRRLQEPESQTAKTVRDLRALGFVSAEHLQQGPFVRRTELSSPRGHPGEAPEHMPPRELSAYERLVLSSIQERREASIRQVAASTGLSQKTVADVTQVLNAHGDVAIRNDSQATWLRLRPAALQGQPGGGLPLPAAAEARAAERPVEPLPGTERSFDRAAQDRPGALGVVGRLGGRAARRMLNGGRPRR